MKRSIFSIALLACVPTGVALAFGDAPRDHGAAVQKTQAELSGQIRSIDAEQSRFVLARGEDETTVQFDESTAWMLDGEKASQAEVLKVGQNVIVTHTKGVATRVDASSEQ